MTGNVPALRTEESRSYVSAGGHKIGRQVVKEKKCRGEEGGEGVMFRVKKSSRNLSRLTASS